MARSRSYQAGTGLTVNFKKRWANHKSDAKNKKDKKCYVAKHYVEFDHPGDDCNSLVITPIEKVSDNSRLAQREFYWQANLGTFRTGGNERKDMTKILKNRVQYTID